MERKDRQLMNTTERIRSLAPSEINYTFLFYVGYSTVCVGALDLDALDRAFLDLQRQHPHLRAGIRESRSDIEFVTTSLDPAQVRVFPDVNPTTHVTGPDTKFEEAEHLAYLDVVPGEEQTRVTLFAHHAIADGRHGLRLLQELWDRYTAHVETDVGVPIEPQPFPRSIEQHLIERQHPAVALVKDTPELSAAAVSIITEVKQHHSGDAAVLPRIRLSSAETIALVALGHAEHVTINALVSAAIIRSHTRTSTNDSSLFYAYPVDLRERVEPPIGLTEGTDMLGVAMFVSEDSSLSLLQLARRIGEQFSASLSEGWIYPSAVTPLEITTEFDDIASSTNWGRIPQLRTPPQLEIIDFQSFFFSDARKFALEPREGQRSSFYAIATFNQRLSVELVKSSPERSAKLLTALADELRGAITASDV